MTKTILGQIRRSVFRIGEKPVHVFIEQALKDQRTYAWLSHEMGNEIAMTESDIAGDVPNDISSIEGFEDCHWLYSSNPMNHGASRLRFDEAAYLYKMIKRMSAPIVVEIGRYKGGTTFLLAAAGAEVISIDNGKLPGQSKFTESLTATLERFGLESCADLLNADALEYIATPETYDMVFLDNGLDSFDMARKFFAHWWISVKRGGYFLFRDGKDTVLSQTAEFVRTLSGDEIGGSIEFNLPGAFVLCTKRS